MASTSHVEETVEDHEEDDGPIPVSKLEVKFFIILFSHQYHDIFHVLNIEQLPLVIPVTIIFWFSYVRYNWAFSSLYTISFSMLSSVPSFYLFFI